MDSVHDLCRLSISDMEVELTGPPDAVDALAEALENATENASMSVAGGHVGVRGTTDHLLRVSLDGTTLWIEGNQAARNIVVSAMRGVAQESREVGFAAVGRHAHIEYLGEDDQWQAEDSLPLIIGADWPE